jgi:hypothetical protein
MSCFHCAVWCPDAVLSFRAKPGARVLIPLGYMHPAFANIARCKVVLHYVMGGFRRYAHARVQARAKKCFSFCKALISVVSFCFSEYFCKLMFRKNVYRSSLGPV